jgi:hypothetical protein
MCILYASRGIPDGSVWIASKTYRIGLEDNRGRRWEHRRKGQLAMGDEMGLGAFY